MKPSFSKLVFLMLSIALSANAWGKCKSFPRDSNYEACKKKEASTISASSAIVSVGSFGLYTKVEKILASDPVELRLASTRRSYLVAQSDYTQASSNLNKHKAAIHKTRTEILEKGTQATLNPEVYAKGVEIDVFFDEVYNNANSKKSNPRSYYTFAQFYNEANLDVDKISPQVLAVLSENDRRLLADKVVKYRALEAAQQVAYKDIIAQLNALNGVDDNMEVLAKKSEEMRTKFEASTKELQEANMASAENKAFSKRGKFMFTKGALVATFWAGVATTGITTAKSIYHLYKEKKAINDKATTALHSESLNQKEKLAASVGR